MGPRGEGEGDASGGRALKASGRPGLGELALGGLPRGVVMSRGPRALGAD